MPANTIEYTTDCPSCGRPLEVAPIQFGPDTAPWLCNACHRGFWSAELTVEARASYRTKFHDWGQGSPGAAVRRGVLAERLHARAAGRPCAPIRWASQR